AGCGTASVTCRLATRHGLNVVGVDLDPRSIERSVRRAAAEAVTPRPGVARMDYSEPGFRDAAFDGILTMETLIHVPDHRAALGQLRRMLRPGGSLVLNESSFSPPSDWPGAEWDRLASALEPIGLHGALELHHGALQESLVEAGFIDIRHLDITAN